MNRIYRILAAKIMCILTLTLLVSQSFGAGVPVVDGANLSQNSITAFESISSCLKQIEEYATQLQQYEDQIRNSLAPSMYIWDKAQSTMNKMLELQNQVDFYINQAGGVDAYLNKFGDVDYYKNSAYFGPGGGQQSQLAKVKEAEKLGLESQKKANENAVRSLEEQQKQLRKDADTLTNLQNTAQSAQGRMEALQYANQFAANQSGQLLQIRAALSAQGAATTAQAQVQQDRDSRRIAATEAATAGEFKKVTEPKMPTFGK